MWLFKVFPDKETLEAAPIEDVAFVVLEQARRSLQNGVRFSPTNVINTIRHESSSWIPGAQSPPEHVLAHAEDVVREAIAWLISERLIIESFSGSGGQYQITRLGQKVQQRGDLSSYAKRAYLPRDVLREDIAEVSLSPFLAGRYDESVRAAFTRLESAIRTAAGYGHGQYGVAMVRGAFNPGKKDDKTNIGPLADPNLEFTERDGVAHLFAGAIGYIKNPLSHRELDIDDARLAASRILLANDLMYTLAAHVESKASRSST